MQLGTFNIPDNRLNPKGLEDIKKIYDSVKNGEIGSADLATLLGYSNPTTGVFYRRINSLIYYGLLSGRGRFKVTELGKAISYPEAGEKGKKKLIKRAVLNVPLWSELYNNFKKEPPLDNFWVQLKNITGIESPEAQKVEREVRKWYLDDVRLIENDSYAIDQDQKSYTSDETNNKSFMSEGPVMQSSTDVLGRITLNGIGTIDITKNTLELVESALKILRNQLGLAKSIEQEENK